MRSFKLSLITRMAVAISGICLVIVLFFPVWRIELNAPQYPEGLCLKIYANGIRGDVTIINGLNHYIGMKSLHDKDFPEFSILPYCIVFFALLFLVTAVANSRKWLVAATALYAVFGVVAMIDFWKWEYNYGHNLDPHAAIVVPGMAYQPPLIGFKQLLNFGAYSIPDIGGWIFVACGAILLGSLIAELKWYRQVGGKSAVVVGLMLAVMAFSGCHSGPEAIKLGRDNCASCRMTIEDPRFGGELITEKGVVLKFDDIQCLQQYINNLERSRKKGVQVFFSDFCNGHSLVAANTSWLLNSQDLHCPMNGHLAAFANTDSLKVALNEFHGTIQKWSIQ